MLRSVAAYLLAVLLSTGLLVLGQGLHRSDWHCPFTSEGDALLILPMVKETLERGTHWTTPRLGAPFEQQLYDFPVVDHLHFAIIRLLGLFTSDVALVFNLFHVLTYPLTACTAMFAFHRLGLSHTASLCGALLYTFLPYHYLRGLHHYFLAAYFVIPLTGWLVLRTTLPQAPSWRTWLAGLVIAALTSTAGAYYAFFVCGFFCIMIVYHMAVDRRWPVVLFQGAMLLTIIVGGVISHAPAILYQKEFGQNSAPTTRTAEEVEEYSLKLTHLVLPVEGHRVLPLERLGSAYDASFRIAQTENRTNSLGIIGTIGLTVLLARVVLPSPIAWPYTPLAVLVAFGLLYASIGGISSLLALVVSPQIRCPNRIMIYLAFFTLLAVLQIFDQSRLQHWPKRHAIFFTMLLAVGLFDQLNKTWFSDHYPTLREAAAKRFRNDAQFFQVVEKDAGSGMVFQLPFVPYPETLNVHQLSGYDQARGYLHTRATRWSFGTMKGRETDQVLREWSRSPQTLLSKLHDWAGVYLDRRGYLPNEADALILYFDQMLGEERKRVHPDGQQFFWPIHPEKLPPSPGDDFQKVRMTWLKGFISFAPVGEEWRHRWCGHSGEAWLNNPRGEPVKIKLKFLLRSATRDTVDLTISGPSVGWSDRLPINQESLPLERELVVPPGRHRVEFFARPPKEWKPTDSRRHVFFIADFHLSE